jgi:hypothetical protein
MASSVFTPAPSSRGQRVLSAFILVHWICVILWVSPAYDVLSTWSLARFHRDVTEMGTGHVSAKDAVGAYLFLTWLWQDWAMFAPDPLAVNRYQDVTVIYADGSQESFGYPRPSELGLWEGRRVYRLRKFQSRFRDLPTPLREDVARYWARRANTHPKNPPARVLITDHMSPIPAPGTAASADGSAPDYTDILRRHPSYQSEVLVDYAVLPGDLE